MDERSPAKPMTGCLVTAILLAAAALYPLSAGPVVMFVHTDAMSPSDFMQLYAPFYWIDDHLLSDYRPFGSYVNLWFGMTGRAAGK